VRDNDYVLTIQVNFMVVCVWGVGGFESNGFVTKVQPFPINGHYRTSIISGIGHSRSNSVMLLVLCMVAVQYPGHQYCTTGPSG
jgi:hypothetical protein